MTDQMPAEMIPTVANPGNTFEPQAEPEPAPISPQTVVSTPQTETPAPDSSILSTKIDKMITREESIEQRRAQEDEYARMQEELRILRTMQGPDFQKRYNEVTKRVEHADDDQSRLMKDLQAELNQMREQQDLLQTQLQQKDQESELMEASQEVSAWVKGNAEHFPLIAGSGHSELVFQKMWNTNRGGTGGSCRFPSTDSRIPKKRTTCRTRRCSEYNNIRDECFRADRSRQDV
jgi:small-conductance mechanosensitive channel